MNSFYGVLASSFYRFTDKEIGAAITAFAREQITRIIRRSSPRATRSSTRTRTASSSGPRSVAEGAQSVRRDLSRPVHQVESVAFEFQSVYESFFSHGAKKRYVGRTGLAARGARGPGLRDAAK